ncbi:MAG TPA: DUF4865 family protein [Pseudonocardiaceae bacterium]|jgi:hypothetical protein|nr:DUF4865 family protein [Pseudonocardiaceae bacterium]
MYAMQYELTLPADYDMEIIRKRVADRGSRTDGFPGLGVKAYLIRERGVDGSPVNQYAPFYVWREISGMNRFLWGGGAFTGIVNDFGRPPVHHWTGVDRQPGPTNDKTPIAAIRRIEPIAPGVDPTDPVRAAQRELGERAEQAGVHSTALAVDPERWELVHFTLWTENPPASAGEQYELLHISHGSD